MVKNAGTVRNNTGMVRKSRQELEAEQRQENLRTVKSLLSGKAVRERFNAILGKKANQFCASLVNVVSGSTKLLDCDPNSIMAAAFVAATYDLPIDSNLGFSAIVPYNGKAQYQMMYKGFVQLAIRTHQYQKMNSTEVYEDELVSYNPITGECEFVTDFSQCTQRASGDESKIAGYYAWFRLLHGYTAELYMSRAEIEKHARKYSRSYQFDIRYGKNSSIWSANFGAMAKKTVLKQLLSKWGILSIEMQRAIQNDQKVYEASGEGVYADNHGEAAVAEDPFIVEGQIVDIEPEDVEESVPDSAAMSEQPEDQDGANEEPEELDITQI